MYYLVFVKVHANSACACSDGGSIVGRELVAAWQMRTVAANTMKSTHVMIFLMLPLISPHPLVFPVKALFVHASNPSCQYHAIRANETAYRLHVAQSDV
jgi:hypothetical protein